jgi:hypothetical protein
LANDGNGSIYGRGGNFLGNFASGDQVFYTGNSGPLTLTFDTPLSTVGAQIDANTYGVFTAQIQAFHYGDLLETFLEDGTVTTNNDNSAIFLGVTDTEMGITSVVYSLIAAPGRLTDFGINQVSIVAAPPVPIPAALPLFDQRFSWVGLGWMSRRKKRAQANG